MDLLFITSTKITSDPVTPATAISQLKPSTVVVDLELGKVKDEHETEVQDKSVALGTSGIQLFPFPRVELPCVIVCHVSRDYLKK